MITQWFVDGITGVLTAVLTLFPSFTLPVSASSWNDFFINIHRLDAVFPVYTVFLVLAAVFVAELAFLSVDLTFFVYHQIWGSD